MNIRNLSKSDLESIALSTMDSRIDPTVAEDLGITTPESANRDIASSRYAGSLLVADEVTQVSPAAMTAPDAMEHAALDAEIGRVVNGDTLSPGTHPRG